MRNAFTASSKAIEQGGAWRKCVILSHVLLRDAKVTVKHNSIPLQVNPAKQQRDED